MIRVALYLVLVGLLALGVAWFADRPGEVAITWQGLRIETSVTVTIVAFVALLAVSILLWSILRGIVRSPRHISEYWRRRRSGQGHLAITRGLLAVGAGDAGLARKYADEAKRLASHEPLTLLLGAQAAQLSGDRAAAERSFREMTEREETRLLGLRGLYVEAQRRDDIAGAHLYAEEAARLDPSLPWAGQAVLQIRSARGDWAGALDIVERNRASGAIDKDTYRRQRAVLLTAQAMASEETDRDAAKSAVLEAVKLAPDLVPAVALAARFLSEAGDIRKASRMLENAWRTLPHPELADAYIHVRLGDSARERLARAKRLNEKAPLNMEGAIALARAAIDAREFVQAREALFPYLDQPTQRIAVLMAKLEQAEFGDEGRAREWTARALRAARDPRWTADGIVSERWMPVSPVSGRIDAFEWKVPLAEIAQQSPDLDLALDLPKDEPILVEEKPVAPPLAAEPAPEAAAAPPAPVASADNRPARAATRPRNDDIVLPTVPAPDDPGPDPDLEREPVPEPVTSGWRRFFTW
jgi:HemY protein